jgi:galactan endo-1,6-beta-galactosidase
VYTKYLVFAQFTRFVRPGMALLENDDHNTVSAFDVSAQKLSFVTVNYGNAQVLTYDLSPFSAHGSVARVTYTESSGGHGFTRFDAPITDHRFQLPAAANSVYSVWVDQVVR